MEWTDPIRPVAPLYHSKSGEPNDRMSQWNLAFLPMMQCREPLRDPPPRSPASPGVEGVSGADGADARPGGGRPRPGGGRPRPSSAVHPWPAARGRWHILARLSMCRSNGVVRLVYVPRSSKLPASPADLAPGASGSAQEQLSGMAKEAARWAVRRERSQTGRLRSVRGRADGGAGETTSYLAGPPQ